MAKSNGYEEVKKLINDVVSSGSVESASGKTSSSKQASSSQQTALPSNNKNSEDYFTSRRKALGLNRSKVDNDYIRSFLDDSQRHMNSVGSDRNRMGFGTSKSVYESRKQTAEDLSKRSYEIRKYLDDNRDAMDSESYASLKKYLDDFDKSSRQSLYAFYRDNQFYSQFESENEWNWYEKYNGKTTEELTSAVDQLEDGEEKKWLSSLAAAREYEDRKNYDLEAGQKEIDDREAELERLKMEQNSGNSGVNSRPYAAGQQAVPEAKYTVGYGITNNRPYAAGQQVLREETPEENRIRELEQEISRRKQYANQAKRIQESEAYANTVKNEDFDQFDDYVKSDDALYNWINDEQFRDSYESNYVNPQQGSVGGSQNHNAQIPAPQKSEFARKGYDQMEANEIAIYNYYHAKGGKEAAQKYLDSIQETLNRRIAEDMYGGIKDNTAAKIVFGAAVGLNQFGSNVENFFNTEDDYIAQTAYQLAGGKVREDLADEGKKFELLGGVSLGQIAYDTVSTTANMAPSILASYAVGAAAGTLGLSAKAAKAVGSYTGSAIMGISAAGGAYQQALNEGFDKDQARGYSILVGASEMAMEKLLGGISAVGGNALGINMTKNIANADTALKAIALRLGGSMISEFGEEYLQEVLDPVFSNIMLKTDKEVKPISVEALYSGILGALSAGFLEGPGTITSEVKTANTGRKIKANESISVDNLKQIGSTFAADSVAYELASKVDENTGAYTIGKLFNEIGASLTQQNVNDISEALMKENVGEISAKEYAKTFARVVDGQKMPDGLVRAMEADPILAKVARETLIDANSTVNQRTQGYNEVLKKLAMDKVKGKKSGKVTPANDQQMTGKLTAEESAVTQNASDGNAETVEEPKVSKIQTIEKGKATVKMDDGTEVDLKDADLDPEDSVRIETIASIDGISAEDASGIFNILKAGSKNSQYDAIGAREAYQYGYYGLPESQLTEHAAFANSLTETQRKAVYEIGQKARQKKVENATFSKTGAPKVAGKVHFDGDRSALNERQQVSLKTMDRIADILGVQIYVFESKVGKNGKRIGENGWYDPKDGSIHIDLYAGATGEATMLFTLAHELTHYIRQWSPQKFKVLADFLMEEYGKKGVRIESLIREQQNKAKRNGRTISYDTAYEEVVADSMEMMLSDGNVMKRLEKLKAQDKDLWSQIKQFVDNMAAKIREVYKGLKPDSKEAELVMEMGDAIYRLQELFAEGLAEASENFQSAEKNTTDEGGVKMMVRENVVDVNGKKYDKVIKPGLTVYESVKHKKRDYISHLRKKIFKRTFTVDDIDGEQIPIEFAKDGETVQKDGANNPHPVLGELEAVTDRLKMIAIINIKDLIKNSKPLTPSSENSHQWLDEGGWRDRISYMTDFDVIYPVILHIPKTRDGRYLLYDISVLKKEGTSIDMDATALAAQSARAPETTENGSQSAVEVLEPSGERVTQPEAKVNNKSTKAMDLEVDEKTESIAPSILYSERTWTESDYVQERDAAAKEIAKAIGVSEKKAKAYIDSVNSIAKMIADDRTRLDYFSSPNRSSFVSNVEYGGSFDFSTLCKKRRLLTGTFTAIQKALPNTALTANEILDIRNRMKDAGLEVSCGLCYVEGSRANMGQFAKEFLRLYKQYYPDAWQPNMADVNTPDGIEWVRINHPECYEQYEYFWNHYGTLKAGDKNLFASQQKPKLYQLHTEYKGEILKKFKDDDNVEEKNLNGGIRLQSFSDFEIVHLIDTMQIIMDMSRVGLAGQAYTKVPDFAWALGDTGLKINLSLIAKGVDENGKLIFDDVEGMPIADAMKLRDRYFKNVGTILVAFNDEQLKAAMADDRVDFIIPFHRSQWKKSQYSAMGLPAKTKDYTFMQNEKFIKPQYHEYRGRMVKDKATNYMPNEYWDFSKSGKENAEAYLQMCARNNKRPKFYKLLQNNGDGSYSLKADGSTDGYWKLLIDFKMYDNAGKGSPQQAVKPEFNMDEATRMLNEYSGGHSNFPVAQGIVDEFVSEYKDSHKGALLSDRDTESVSNRSLLANAMESLVKTELEKKKLNEYKAKIDQINAEEQKLSEVRAQIKEMSFAKGPRDKEKLRALRDEAIKLSHHIGIYDKQLLRLEASKPLQNVLDREKAKAYQRGKEKGEAALKEYKQKAMTEQEQMKKRYEESRKRSIENRNKTAMRHKIQNVVKELNSLLLTNDKKRHVPDNLKKAVAAALDLVNMDTVDAENRAAKYADLIAKEQSKANPDQDKIDSYTMTMENILRQGEKMGQRIKELHAAYEEIQNSDDPDIANAYDPVIAGAIQELSATIGNTSIKNMTMEQLSDVYDVYRAVLTRVRDANKAMAENIRASIEELAKSTIREVQTVGGAKKYRVSNLDAVRKFDWNNMKPVYAMERIGSSTLTEVFNNVRAGEDTWAKDVSEAREYYLEKSKKYGYDKWDFDKKYRFESNSGIPFELTLEQILSLYAYSKREQAADHLRLGGFVFDSNIETYQEKDGKKSLLKYKVNTADAHQITPEIMADIISKLSKEQTGFVDEMQDYLSTVMGAKGNEVTSKMYGVKLFKEKFYFPLKSAKQFMFEQNEVSGEVRIKNSGFTNKVVAKANNPVILSNFMDVWSGHVNDMSMYHAFTLPLEDFNRVFNYNPPKKDGVEPVSVKGTIQNAYGPAAVSYVKQLITDLNGGARTDSTTGVINKLTGMFKKGAVFASLSVVVQQPSAIARAAALVDTKYFIGPKVDQKRHKYLWAEVKKYAPVAIIKEMGYFDTNMGKSTQDFITGKEYSGIKEQAKAVVTDSAYRDELLSKAPALADEYAWCGIWAAVKRETKAKHPSMDTTSEAFLKMAGKRFTEVITKTQVYDSVLARSANMRSKDTGMKMATAFMAEPTTSINMIEDAIWKAKRGDKKYAGKAVGAVIASQILNSILVSFVYAGRDDDEDETYAEKYIGALTGSLVDGLNVATYIPFIKDIVSITQGYDVERSDMAVVSDLWNAWKNLKNDKVSPYRKVENFAGSIAQIFGLPVKNIMRDVRGIYNTITNLAGVEQTTGSGVKYAISGAITGKSVSDKEQLYKARLDGDQQHAARVAARYDDEDSADAAVRAAIKDGFMADEIDEATALKHMVLYAGMDGSEAHWTMDAWKYRKKVGSDEGYGKYGKFHDAVRSGENLESVIKEYTDNGVKTSTLTGQITEEFKPVYLEASVSDRKSMKAKLINAYVACDMEREDAEEKLESWDFEAEYGFAYSDRKETYLSGKVSKATLVDILIDRGYDEEDAEAQVEAYEWEAAGFEDVTTSAIRNYNEWCEPVGISKSVYLEFWRFDNSTENDVDETTGKKIAYSAVKKIMAYIDSLDLTDRQKDALAKSAGWADKTIQKYKLW